MQDAHRPVRRAHASSSPFGLEPLEARALFSSSSASLLADIAPGAASSASPHQLDAPVLAGSRALFAAADGTGAQSLWATDGTAGGTVKLSPVFGAGSSVQALAASAGVAYAIASNGLLYWSDGTPAGTKVVGDGGLTLRQEPFGAPGADSFVSMDGAVYFSAQSLQGGDGYELWRGTGVFASRVKDIRPGSTSSSPRNLTVVGHTIFFTVSTGTGVPQFELWKSDGSSSGTVLVRSFDSGLSASHNPDYLTNVNGTLFFRATGPSGDELWKSDGTAAGTVLVKAIGGSLFANNVDLNLTAVGGTVYFAANGSPTGQTGIELWKSDGTANGTVRVKDIEPGPGGSEPAVIRAAGDGRHVFFSALTGAEGRELWTSDGTDAGTYRVADLYAGWQSSNPYPLLGAADGSTYFSAITPDAGRELWATDGTPAGTYLVRDINPGTGNALSGLSPGDPMLALPPTAGAPTLALFWAYDGTHGQEPWTVGAAATPASTVVGRHLFYNHGRYDGYDIDPDVDDDGAIAPDKTALRAGQVASFANVTGNTQGVNGVMIDFDALPQATDGLTADDFVFRVGRSSDPTAWADAPAPSAVAVRRGAGEGGGDCVTLTWADGAIKNAWLQVTVKAGGRTGLAADDVFYFGSLVGETGDEVGGAPRVSAADYAAVRMNLGRPATIATRFDFDRDGRVDALDLLAARANLLHGLPAPETFDPAPTSVTPAAVAPPPALAGTRVRDRRALAAALP